MYILLLLLAMLAIFDTQILSIFRRQKEIGTFIALGMTRKQVVKLFTIEGGMNSVLAALVAAVYGVPLLIMQNKMGYAMPYEPDDFGIAISEVIYPSYSLGLIVGTIIIVMVTATVVSYMPARKIAKMNPTDAIKGKIQ
jgi:ABC-type antimicrobial peptide transport system permease subunit